MFPVTPILCEISISDQPVLLFIAASALVVITSVVRNVIGAVRDVRSMKKEQSQSAQQFATREELREVHARVDGLTASLSGELGKFRGELLSELASQRREADKHREIVVKDLAAIERSLGRLEGQEGLIEQHSKSISELQKRHS